MDRKFGLLALPALLLSGCASYGPQRLPAGASVAEVAAAMGPPTGRYARPGGERIEYARGPFGKHTYMLDFDTQGRMITWQQVLTEPTFDALRVGSSRDQVLQTIGHPSEATRVALRDGALWSYRYEGPFCKWFQVSLDPAGQVVETGYGPDPMCNDNDPGRSQ